MKKKIRISIAGARGYTGQELVKILLRHPGVELAHLYASEEVSICFDEEFPYFQGRLHLPVEKLDLEKWKKDEDLFFLALPHGVAMQWAPTLLAAGVKVIDLSADYRLKDSHVFEKWYHAKHADAENLAEAVYGLPELHKKEIEKASLIANPGCYPTSAILACVPALNCKDVPPQKLIIDSKSGVSGAGRKPSLTTHFPEVAENFRAYNVTEHRHTPEIESQLSEFTGKEMLINFTPHLLPITRGILSTVYIDLSKKVPEEEWIARYKRFYAKAPFARIRRKGHLPETKDVAGTNFCDIGLKVDPRTNRLIVISVIDNLVKGASGQAVQNMNLMFGLDETTGLIV